MTLDEQINQVIHTRPNITVWLDMWKETGFKTNNNWVAAFFIHP